MVGFAGGRGVGGAVAKLATTLRCLSSYNNDEKICLLIIYSISRIFIQNALRISF